MKLKINWDDAIILYVQVDCDTKNPQEELFLKIKKVHDKFWIPFVSVFVHNRYLELTENDANYLIELLHNTKYSTLETKIRHNKLANKIKEVMVTK
jgi:hypothetical protein